MDTPGDANETNVAAPGVASLHEQADALRDEIARLRRELSEVQGNSLNAQAADLIEANSQLVMSALHAEQVAETAAGALDGLAQTSQRDALTGTPNRTVMLDRLDSAIALARRHGTHAAVLFLDLDRFKEINDSLGHAAGDDVLQLVTTRLRTTLRDSDTISRHGGDEFLILLPEVGHATDAALAAAKVLLAIAEPTLVAAQTLHISASVGIAIFPADGADGASLIAAADTAMYRSKLCERGGFAFHTESLLTESIPSQHDLERSRAGELEERVQELRRVNEKLVVSAPTMQGEDLTATDRQEQIRFLTTTLEELRDHHAAMSTGAEPARDRCDALLLVRLKEALERQLASVLP